MWRGYWSEQNSAMKTFGRRVVEVFEGALKERRPFQEQIPLLGCWGNASLELSFLTEGRQHPLQIVGGLPCEVFQIPRGRVEPTQAVKAKTISGTASAAVGKSAGKLLFKNFHNRKWIKSGHFFHSASLELSGIIAWCNTKIISLCFTYFCSLWGVGEENYGEYRKKSKIVILLTRSCLVS